MIGSSSVPILFFVITLLAISFVPMRLITKNAVEVDQSIIESLARSVVIVILERICIWWRLLILAIVSVKVKSRFHLFE